MHDFGKFLGECDHGSSFQAPRQEHREVKNEISGRKPFSNTVTCHGCGEIGHIRPQCPKTKPRNVSRVVTDSNSDSEGFIVSGSVWH